MRSINLYLKIIKYRLKSQLQYPIDATIGFINQFLIIFLEFISICALFKIFGEIDGWELKEMLLIYGIVNFAFSVSEVFMRGFESNMTGLIRSGEYDRYLLRPLGSVWQVSAFSFQFVRLGRGVHSAIILMIAIFSNRNSITGGEWLVLLYSVIGGCLLYFSLYIITGIIVFKVMQYTEFMSIFIQGSVTTMQYPMSAFPKWIQRFFTFVLPVTLVTYYPISVILDKSTMWLNYLCPCICYILFFFVVLLYYIVEQSYISSGS